MVDQTDSNNIDKPNGQYVWMPANCATPPQTKWSLVRVHYWKGGAATAAHHNIQQPQHAHTYSNYIHTQQLLT